MKVEPVSTLPPSYDEAVRAAEAAYMRAWQTGEHMTRAAIIAYLNKCQELEIPLNPT